MEHVETQPCSGWENMFTKNKDFGLHHLLCNRVMIYHSIQSINSISKFFNPSLPKNRFKLMQAKNYHLVKNRSANSNNTGLLANSLMKRHQHTGNIFKQRHAIVDLGNSSKPPSEVPIVANPLAICMKVPYLDLELLHNQNIRNLQPFS